jgi:hypothetical protein
VVVKTVRCEACGSRYVYTLTRKAVGQSSGFLVPDDETARQRAAENLTKALEPAAEGPPAAGCASLIAGKGTHVGLADIPNARGRPGPRQAVRGAGQAARQAAARADAEVERLYREAEQGQVIRRTSGSWSPS